MPPCPPLLVGVALAAERVDVPLEVVATQHCLPGEGLHQALLLVHLKSGKWQQIIIGGKKDPKIPKYLYSRIK